MLQNRNLKRDVFALLTLSLAGFLGLSLLSYHAGDPPGQSVHPPGTEVLNLCGPFGALCAELLLRGVGIVAYVVVLAVGVVACLMLAQKEVSDPGLRAVGGLMALAGLATAVNLAFPGLSVGPVIGPGGYLGAAGRAALEMNFATPGAVILVVSVVLAGLLLSTDYVLFRLASLAVAVPVIGIVRFAGLGRSGTVGDTSSMTKNDDGEEDESEDEEDDEEDEETELSIRIGRKRVEEAAEDEDSDEDDSDAEDDDEETEEADDEEAESDDDDEAELPATGKAGVGQRLASALRIRNKVTKKTDRDVVIQELEAASRSSEEALDYELPPLDLLQAGEEISHEEQEKEVRQKAKILEKAFASFGFNVKVVEIETGPVIAQYELELETGLRLSKITSLADDIAIALRVPSVRIVAPIPGKNTVGIEVPNSERQLVRLREVIEECNGKAKKMKIPIYLGKDVSGNSMVADLTTLPHLLIAGRTGTGKSVCLNSIIVSMLMTKRPDEVRMLMIDPKMVELSPYKKLPHLMHPVVTDMRKAEAILAWAVEKMEERYALLARAGVRHLSVYNQLGEEELMDRLQPENDEQRKEIPLNLPYIVIVADEMADLMMTAGKEVEQHIIRLAQKSRAVGIHLILATQKPTVDVITGLIKSNLPARIAFQVASRTDSRVVLDEMGADKLLGNGDMLFLWPGTSTLLRGQGTYLSDEEINGIVDFVGTTEPQFVKELVQLKATDSGDGKPGKLKNRDELYEAAIDVVVREGRGSCSLLQRALGIGYGRAARLIDFMAEDGIVGQYNGSQARDVLITLEQLADMIGGDAAPEPAPTAKQKRSNKILPEPEPDEEDEDLEESADDAEDEYEEEDEDDSDSDDEDEESEEELDDEDDEEEEYEDEEEDEEEPEPAIRSRSKYKAESA